MRRLVFIAFAALAACQPQDPFGRSPAQLRQEKAGCATDGGTWRPGGITAAEMCFRPTPDAGKSCRKASDCSGACLADTRTCSTMSPMFGCYGFLDDEGREAEICVD